MASGSGIDQLREIAEQFEQDRNSATDRLSLDEIRTRYLSRKSGLLTLKLQSLRSLPKNERSEFGKFGNALKQKIEASLAEVEDSVAAQARQQQIAEETLDVSLPGSLPRIGHRHPITLVRAEMESIFVSMGYTVEDGPEVESTYYNFEALNIPAQHPARDPSDTFYVSDEVVLRTHTSPVQVRTMERQQPPIRIICPGRVFRHDDLDATHSPMFHQIEGLVVDKGINFGDLKGTLELFHHRFFGPNTETRFRPSFFPFTEPSAEVDISCPFCEGSGCRVCKQTGWIETMGAGMVNPVLYNFVKYDPELYSGFAFGMGIDRYAMIKYRIRDIPLLFENDLRFLEQF
jgi:phenylalanyl-tRNA synthetase alpha chain